MSIEIKPDAQLSGSVHEIVQPSEQKTDMNALIRRAAFGMTEEEMNEAMAERKKPQPTDSNWLQRLYLASRGSTVKNDDEKGEN